MPTSPSHLSAIDLLLVALYLVAITLFGLRFSRGSKGKAKDKSLKNYFLANNTIPWWAIALSIVSAETSTLTIISIPGVAYAGDFGFLQIVIGYMLGRIVVAMLFLPRYFRGEMLTAYQLIDRRFGSGLHKLTAGLFLLTRAAAEGVRVFAISIVVGIAIGTGDILSIGIISALTLLYTFEGGMAAVIWTDVVQMALYVAGTVVAIFTLSSHVPGGWSHIHAVAAPLGKFHMLTFAFNLTKAYTFWAGVLGGTFLTMASHGTDQLMVQRMLAARNLRESRLALLSSGVVIFLQFTLFLLIGVGLFVFYGEHPQAFTSADRIFPTFIVHEMPRGVAGLLVAAILAAAMSNLSAALNSLASTTVVDFYMDIRPNAEAQERMLVSRLATIFWAFALFGIAVYSIQAGGKGHVVEMGLSIASVAYGCLLGVFLLGTLTKYATQWGTIVGMFCGFVLNITLWLPTVTTLRHIGPLTIPQVAFTWYVILGTAVTFAVGSAVSLLSPQKRLRQVTAMLVVLCIVPSAFCLKTAAHVDATPDFTPISNVLNQAIEQKKIPGAVVVVGHKDRVVFEQAYGLRKLAGEPGLDGKPSPAEVMTKDTIFDMASLSKVLVTTVAVLQLYDDGKVSLDAPVANYLPEFGVNGKEKITVRELLTHYSGLPEDVNLKDAWGLATPDMAEGIHRAMNAVPIGPAGVMFKYSDINFITLGALVERLSDQSLDVYARQHIFLAMGMNQSGYHAFHKTCGPAIKTGAAVSAGPKPVGRIGIVCLPGTWSPYILDPMTAPTAHDNELTAEANPDFDRLLRGSVHDPTTRRMGGVAGHAGVFSTAADISKFCQALLDKLLRDTGPFPLKRSTLQLAISPQAPATAALTATIFTPGGDPIKGVAERGLGWDINSAFSRPRGGLFPITTTGHPGSFGHTGFTGTSIWIDPTSDTYVVLLSNAIHPRGAPPISPLRGEISTAVAKAFGIDGTRIINEAPMAGGDAAVPATLTGIDVLELSQFVELKTAAARHGGKLRFALLTNQAGIDRNRNRTIDILLHADPSLELTTLFTPEHGLSGRQDVEQLAAETDTATHLPVVSLYGPKPSDKRPTPAQLANLDAIVVDLQDIGVRFWTYEAVVGYFLEATACTNVELIVLDRPNPIGGLAVQGPVSQPGGNSYINYMPMPVRHGMTLGEIARYYQGQTPVSCEVNNRKVEVPTLTIVPMQHWSRGEFFDETQLPWTPPSPNMRSLATAIPYPGVGLTEQTNISVGRGTETPYEHIGAAWMTHPKALAEALEARHIAGVRVTPTTLTVAETPNKYPGHGQTIPGVHFEITDRVAFDSPEFGIELLSALHHLYPLDFQLEFAKTLVANPDILSAIRTGTDPGTIAASWQAELDSFKARRARALIYP